VLNTHGDLRYWIRKILNTEDIEYRRHSVWSIDITGNTQCVSNIYIVYSYTVTPCVLNTHDIRYWTHKTFGSNINITENTPCVLNIQCIVYTLYWMYTILFVLNTRDIHVFNTVENIIYSYTVRIGYTQWQSLWSTHTHTHTHTHTQTHTSDIRYAIWLLQAIHRVYWIHTVIFCYIQYSWIYNIYLHRAYWIHTVTFAIKYIRHSDWNMTITGNTQCILNVRHDDNEYSTNTLSTRQYTLPTCHMKVSCIQDRKRRTFSRIHVVNISFNIQHMRDSCDMLTTCSLNTHGDIRYWTQQTFGMQYSLLHLECHFFILYSQLIF